MAADEENDEAPDRGAVFTFGKSRFEDSSPGRFWIRDDPVLHVACGDEHTALITANGRVFTFGNNEWGQLGLGHTKAVEKPTCVKTLKNERATVVSCGRSHTLVATDSGGVFGFGANSEHQIGVANGKATCQDPVSIQGLQGVHIKMLSAGAEHSIALTEKGVIYVWGGGNEGQLGLGEKTSCTVPTALKTETSAIAIAAGYYHSAFITVEGKLFTFGESEGGKLGLTENQLKKSARPQCVANISNKLMWVTCGGNHTVAVSADGTVYSFGDGRDGQLGLGNQILDSNLPQQISSLEGVKIARSSCGESHTALLAEGGRLYVCGDGRHGKLGIIDDESLSNQFIPTFVQAFNDMAVQQVACGGCHTVVLAVKVPARHNGARSNDLEAAIINNDNANPAINAQNARARRRQRNLPPLQISTNVNDSPDRSPFNKAKLPGIRQEVVIDDSGVVEVKNSRSKKLEKRRSMLQEAENDQTIRHMDSDTDSSNSDHSESMKLIKESQTSELRSARLASGEILSPLIPSDDEGDVSNASKTAESEITRDKSKAGNQSQPNDIDKQDVIQKDEGIEVFQGSPSRDGKAPSGRLARMFGFQKRKTFSKDDSFEKNPEDKATFVSHIKEPIGDTGSVHSEPTHKSSPLKSLRRKSESKSSPKKHHLLSTETARATGTKSQACILL